MEEEGDKEVGLAAPGLIALATVLVVAPAVPTAVGRAPSEVVGFGTAAVAVLAGEDSAVAVLTGTVTFAGAPVAVVATFAEVATLAVTGGLVAATVVVLAGAGAEAGEADDADASITSELKGSLSRSVVCVTAAAESAVVAAERGTAVGADGAVVFTGEAARAGVAAVVVVVIVAGVIAIAVGVAAETRGCAAE